MGRSPPHILFKQTNSGYTGKEYKVGSPNLIGRHPARNLVAFKKTPTVVFDGIVWQANRIFGMYVADVDTIHGLAEAVDLSLYAH